MALTDLNIPAFLDTSSADLIADFFTPLLAASVRYDRGVGYFSSGWLRAAGKGMAAFAANGGKARWVTSPILDEQDWKALETGDMARRDLAVYEAIRSTLTSLAATLEQETLAALVERYERLSAKIVRLMHQKEEEAQAALKMLLMQRADLLNNAANKLPVLSDLIDAEARVEHTLRRGVNYQ